MSSRSSTMGRVAFLHRVHPVEHLLPVAPALPRFGGVGIDRNPVDLAEVIADELLVEPGFCDLVRVGGAEDEHDLAAAELRPGAGAGGHGAESAEDALRGERAVVVHHVEGFRGEHRHHAVGL